MLFVQFTTLVMNLVELFFRFAISDILSHDLILLATCLNSRDRLFESDFNISVPLIQYWTSSFY